MNDEVKFMMKKIIMNNFLIAIIISVIIAALSTKQYALVFLSGCAVAIFNFIINSVIVNLSLSGAAKNSLLLIGGMFLRVFFAAFIGYKAVIANPYNIIPYVFGYSSHFLGMLTYGLTNK